MMGVDMHGGAKSRHSGNLRTELLWKDETVGSIIIRRATLDRADRGHETFRASGFLLVTPAHTALTKLGIQPIQVRAEHLGGVEYDWYCERMADYMRARTWDNIIWIA